MFDSKEEARPPRRAEVVDPVGVDALDADATLDRARESQRRVNLADAEVMALAAHWADMHGVLDGPGADEGRALPGMERLIQYGGEGTPEVAEFAPAELAAELGISPAAGLSLIADALDLRHRLPRLWQRVLAGEVRRWMARKAAQETRELSVAAAGQVDARITPWVGRVGGGRFCDLLEAAVIAADPEAARERADAAQDQRGVWVTSGLNPGERTVVAKTDTASAVMFDATIDRIAAGLRQLGDTDCHDRRRAKAIGVIANPQASLQLFDAVAHDAATTGMADVVADEYTAHGQQREDEGASSEGWVYRNTAQEDAPDVWGRLSENAASRLQCMCGCHASQRFDPATLRPKATLYVHLTRESVESGSGVARVEGVGPVTVDQVRELLGHGNVTVKPVLDPENAPGVDGYEATDRLQEAVRILTPADAFPFATGCSRQTDLDHTIPYDHDHRRHSGDPPQTRVGNLAPLSRRHHRVKTFGRWDVRQPFPGIMIWRSPHNRYYLVDPTGTRRLN